MLGNLGAHVWEMRVMLGKGDVHSGKLEVTVGKLGGIWGGDPVIRGRV